MATIYDVAKRAGVSHTAASAVLNNRELSVGAETRKRILQAAQELEYRPNRAAKQLATGKFNSIGLCFERAERDVLLNPIATQLIAGVATSASDNGLFLVLAPTSPEDHFEEVIDAIPQHGVDGAIVIGPIPLTKSAISAVNNCRIPLVCIDCYPGFTNASTVDKDNILGIKRGVQHLIANGHRRMVYVGPAPDYQCHLDRMRGFYDVIRENDLAIGDQVTRIAPVSDVPAVLRETLGAKPAPTAFVCGERSYGTAVWDEATAMGLEVPGDIAILVYDDPPAGHPSADHINIIQNVPYDMGKAAADLLEQHIENEHLQPTEVRLPPKLVLRPCPVRLR